MQIASCCGQPSAFSPAAGLRRRSAPQPRRLSAGRQPCVRPCQAYKAEKQHNGTKMSSSPEALHATKARQKALRVAISHADGTWLPADQGLWLWRRRRRARVLASLERHRPAASAPRFPLILPRTPHR